MPLIKSDLQFVRSARGVLAELLPQVVPGWSTYDDGTTWCDEQRKQLRRLADERVGTEQLIDTTTDDLMAGDPPTDFVARMRASLVVQTDLDRAGFAVDRIESSLAGRRDAAVQGAAPTLYAALDTRLQTTIEAARRLDLGTAYNGDEAIEQGRADTWTRFTQLRAEHHHIREAQARMARAFSDGSTNDLDTFGFFKDYAALFPMWHRWSPSGTVSFRERDSGSVEHIRAVPPWPDLEPGHDRTAVEPARFRWLVDHPDVDVWIPTARQLSDAIQAAREALRPPTPQEKRAMEQAAQRVVNERMVDEERALRTSSAAVR